MFARIKGAVPGRRGGRAESRSASGRPTTSGPSPGVRSGRRAFGTPDGHDPRRARGGRVPPGRRRIFSRALRCGRSSVAWPSGGETTAGNPWKPTELRRLLRTRARRAARASGRGRRPGALARDHRRGHASRRRGDPVRPGAQQGRPPRRYLLTGLARCGVCGGSIYGVTEPRGPLYCETRRTSPAEPRRSTRSSRRHPRPAGAAGRGRGLRPGRRRAGAKELQDRGAGAPRPARRARRGVRGG